MKYMIIGASKHGKDTAAELLADMLGVEFRSSSLFACDRAVLPTLSKLYGYESVEEAYNDRDAHRKEWFDLIAKYNAGDPSRLMRELYQEADMYVGCRNPVEYHAGAAAGLFNVAIWIDASQRVGPLRDEGYAMIRPEDADIVIDNNGTLNDLVRRVEVLANAIKRCEGIVKLKDVLKRLEADLNTPRY